MGLFDFLSAFSSGTSLKVATKSAPNSMGCYKIFLNGSLKYVGKAEDGIRKRFVQYYNGTTAHYPSAQKIYEHRDEICVQACSIFMILSGFCYQLKIINNLQ